MMQIIGFLKKPKELMDNKLIRFLLVGGINTVFGYSVFSLAIFLKVHYAIAALLGQALGTLFNFATISRLVFDSKENKLIFKFIGVYVFTYMLNVLALRFLRSLNVDIYLAAAIITLPIALIGFLLNKNLVFKGI